MSYFIEVLWDDNQGRWIKNNGIRFATHPEAQAYIEDLAVSNAKRDEPRRFEARIMESEFKPTHVWNFEHAIIVSRGQVDADDLRSHGWRTNR